MHPYIHIFGLKIPAYGVMVLLAVVTAYFALAFFSRREKVPFDKLENLFIATFIAAIVGARIFYLIEHNQFSLINLIKVWEGGLDFFGGFVFAAVTVLVGIKALKLPFWKVLDIAAISLILAHSVGRLGCWLAGCCYGKPTDLPIGVVFPPESIAPSGVALYPTQLMEATGNFIGYLLLFYIYKKGKPFDGIIVSLYLIWYGTERFLLEFIRGVTPPIPGLGLTWNQIVALGGILTGIVFLVFTSKRTNLL
jgi:phosphatidylglycerol:prolipoprotein diacylglycerol transferase